MIEIPITNARQRNRNFSYPQPQAAAYRHNLPFPHVALQGCWDGELLRRCRQDIQAFQNWDGEKDFFGSKKKRYCGNMEILPESVTSIISEASSPSFLTWLTELTGEPALIPDPYLEGGGIHQIARDGFLKVHADFNWNERLQLYRRLNLLLYLNDGWDENWGGALELWAKDMSSCHKRIAPHSNTMVIFTTDDRSFHGHPRPLACPADMTRSSIALYYYSPVRPASNFRARRHGTDYRPIAGDNFERYDSALTTRIRNRLRRLFT